VNGEAIYGTRHWVTHQEGDLRFTRKGNTLYAIALEWPEETTLTLQSLAGKEVSKVEVLGLTNDVKWKVSGDGLTITTPSTRPGKYAYTFKIVCNSL
jgi:alpha-L-fucosidase